LSKQILADKIDKQKPIVVDVRNNKIIFETEA